jgi:uncharacterized membrane protein YobD (UPF0266 family)
VDRTRAHNKALRHRIYRVIFACVVAVLLVSTVVHLWSFWTAWKVTVVIGLAVVVGLLVSGIVFGRRILHR